MRRPVLRGAQDVCEFENENVVVGSLASGKR
jgi:hypothetical protein